MKDLFEARETTGKMRLAATAFLENLSREQRAKAMMDFGDEAERRDWDFIPKQGRKGLPLKEMDSRQRTLAHQLIAVGVSLPAYSKVVSIIALENVLRELQKERMGFSAPEFRNPGNYFLSFFGKPNMEERWGWRVVGHHVSLNFTIVDGFYLAPTPSMLGAEPAEYGAIRPLKEDEDLGFDLLHSLSTGQRKRAVIHDVAPPDFVTRVVPRIGTEELPEEYELGFDSNRITDHDRQMLKYLRSAAKGLPGSAMDKGQLAKLAALVECYINRMPGDVASRAMERLEKAGMENVSFAWAGKEEYHQPHYYRLQGPSFLVEFDNVQQNGNHIHTVWRDPENDFGDDLLLRHYREEHVPVRIGRVTSSSS